MRISMRAAAGLLALALLVAVRGRSVWTGIVLAAATLTKFLPAVVLPAFWRPRDWRLPVAFVRDAVSCCICRISRSAGRCSGFSPGYASEEGFASGHGIFLLQLLGSVVTLPDWASQALHRAGAGVLGLLAARFAFGADRCRRHPAPACCVQARQAVILGAALLVALSPHYPWYFALARAARLPRAAAECAVDAGRRAVAGAWRRSSIWRCPRAVYVPAAILACSIDRAAVKPARCHHEPLRSA